MNPPSNTPNPLWWDYARDIGCNCRECPLGGESVDHLAPPTPPEGPLTHPSLIIVGEAPGDTEAEQGRPFVGRSGYYLRQLFARIGIDRRAVYITNVAKCVSQGLPEATRLAAARACKPWLDAELTQLSGCNTILAFGGDAQYVLTGKRNITNWAGAPYPCVGHDQFTVFPTFHPAYILRKEGRAWQPVLAAHAEWAWLHARGKLPKWEWPKIHLYPSAEVVRLLKRILREKPWVSFDVETRGLDPSTASLMAFGIATKGIAICVQWEAYRAGNHGMVPPIETRKYGTETRDLIRAIVEDPEIPLMLQNGQHDLLSCKRLGWAPQGYRGDTLAAHSLLLPGIKHNLNTIAMTECHCDRWKPHFRVGSHDRGLAKFEKSPPEELRTYCAKDAFGTYWTGCESLEPQIDAGIVLPNGRAIYDAAMDRMHIAIEMRERGVCVDPARIARHQRRVRTGIASAARDLRKIAALFEYKGVPRGDPIWRDTRRALAQSVKRHKELTQQLTQVDPSSDEYATLRAKRLLVSRKRRVAKEAWDALKAEQGFRPFNPGSLRHVQDILFDKLHVEPTEYTPGGQPQINNALLKRCRSHPTPLVTHFARALSRYRQWTKQYAYTLQAAAARDHIMHPVWNPGCLRTTRWASENPNVLNIPKPVKKKTKRKDPKTGEHHMYIARPGLRDIFVAHNDGWVVAGDQQQLELRILAQLAGATALVDMIVKGIDPHWVHAEKFYQKPRAELEPQHRQVIKVQTYATMYDGSDETILEQTRLQYPRITLRAVKQWRSWWNREYPEFARYFKERLAFATENDFEETPLDHNRTYFHHMIEKSRLINWPVQTTGAEILNRCLRPLRNALDWPTEGIMFQYHDEFTLDGPDPIRLYRLLKKYMRFECTIDGVPMVYDVDVKVGKSWGTAREVTSEDQIREMIAEEEARAHGRDSTPGQRSRLLR
jgi:uracil-DNA glycosylase family 4